MADTASAPSITLLQAVLSFSGVVLAPVIGTIAALLSRSAMQRRQQEIEYKIKRLDLIEKAVSVGHAISNNLQVTVDVSVAHGEYLKILNSLYEPEPPTEHELLPFERHSFPLRLLMLPKPTSVSGWIAIVVFYIYLVTGLMSPVIFLSEHASSLSPEKTEEFDRFRTVSIIINVIVSFVLCALARWWAIRAAKASIRRDREAFEQTASPNVPAPPLRNS
jgi:hypothetical protein